MTLPWIQFGMSFLAGLPEAKRRRRLLVPLQAYVDDSGTVGTDAVIVLAGFVGRADRWLQFSNQWQTLLNSSPKIKYLKMHEATKLQGEFEGWEPLKRDIKLLELVDALRRFPPLVRVHIATDVDAFHQFRDKIPAPNIVSNPYFTSITEIILSICNEALRLGQTTEVEIIFDRHDIFSRRIQLWYPPIRELIAHNFPALDDVMPHSLHFKDDVEFLPLQVADMAAWFTRMGFSKRAHEFDWVGTILSEAVSLSRHAHFFDAASLSRVASGVPLLVPNFPDEWITFWKSRMKISDKMLRAAKTKKKKRNR